MHTLRELILGAYLSSKGFKVEHDRRINGKTPDWVILNNESSPGGIVELINFHTDMSTEKEIEKQLKEPDPWSVIETPHGPVSVASYWKKPNNSSLYQRIKEKSDKYEHLARKYDIPYVVAVFCDIKAGVEAEEIHECLFEDEGGLFKDCPTLSGVLFFEESLGPYEFRYIQNPHGIITLMI